MRIFLEKGRKYGFFAVDALKGGYVRQALRELKKCDESDFDSDYVQALRTKRLSELLLHAKSTTPFYARVSADRLEDFPIIHKAMMKEDPEAFLSSACQDEKVFYMSTSGSTGTPFVVRQNGRKKKQVNAECIYYSRKLGYDIGENLTYLRSVVRQVQKSKLKQFVQNQPLICCNDLSKSGIEAIFEEMKKSGGGRKTLLAYASTLDAIGRYCEEHGASLARSAGIKGIISGSEMLQDKTREQVARAFGCQCVSRYSNEENGILGQDDLWNNVFPVNEASYYIEILKLEKDTPAEPGEVGRIVVTDYYNYAMPMIRYDTGDLGAMEVVEYNGKKRRAITSFSGRKLDSIYTTKGMLISSNAITNLMWEYTELRQFQLVQTDAAAYCIKLNAARFFREKELLAELKTILGADANIMLEYVEEIPVLNSGKRKYVVNEFMQKSDR